MRSLQPSNGGEIAHKFSQYLTYLNPSGTGIFLPLTGSERAPEDLDPANLWYSCHGPKRGGVGPGGQGQGPGPGQGQGQGQGAADLNQKEWPVPGSHPSNRAWHVPTPLRLEFLRRMSTAV